MQRTGKVGQPSFRIVLQEHTEPVKREAKEILGNYNPALKDKPLIINIERAKYWLSKGAEVSDSLAVLLKNKGVERMDKFIEPRNKKRKKKDEEETKPEAAKTPEAPKVEHTKKEEKAPETPPPAPEAPAEPPAPKTIPPQS